MDHLIRAVTADDSIHVYMHTQTYTYITYHM